MQVQFVFPDFRGRFDFIENYLCLVAAGVADDLFDSDCDVFAVFADHFNVPAECMGFDKREIRGVK